MGMILRRVHDWLRQAKRNLLSARVNFNAELYEETCYESHQAAEKAIKALLQQFGVERRGYSLLYLVREIQSRNIEIPKDIMNCVTYLDKHYIPSRYPDVFSEGAPMDYYSRDDGLRCIDCAEEILKWVDKLIKGAM